MSKLTVEEVRTLIDDGTRLEAKIKPENDRLKEIKNTLKAHAEATKNKLLKGLLGDFEIIGDKETDLSYEVLVEYLQKKKLKHLMPKILTVSIKEAKKELGEAVVDKIATVTPKPYAKGKFKPIPGLALSEMVKIDLSKVAEVLKVVDAAKARVSQQVATKPVKKPDKVKGLTVH